jgi:hypothetical protein
MIYKVQYEFNKEILDSKITQFNDGVHDTVLNITVTFHKKVYNAFLLLESRMSETKTDTRYDRLLLRTSMNIQKIFDGIRGNFFISFIANPILKSMENESKFPMIVIDIIVNCNYLINHNFFLQGVYRFTNLAFPGGSLPVSGRITTLLNFTVRTSGSSKKVWALFIQGFGTINI